MAVATLQAFAGFEYASQFGGLRRAAEILIGRNPPRGKLSP